MKIRALTIRTRLMLGFVAIALLLAFGISIGSTVVGYYNAQQRALDQLESVAARKETEINIWARSPQSELAVALNEEYALDRTRIVLDLARENKYYDFYFGALRNRLELFLSQSSQLNQISILDLSGRVILSTDVTMEGNLQANTLYFQRGQLAPTTVFLPGTFAYTAVPVTDSNNQVMGVLVARSNMQPLERILKEQTGLNQTGKAYLIDPTRTLIFGAMTATSSAINSVAQTHANGQGVYADYRGVSVAGVYRWLPDLQIALLIEQDLAEVVSTVYLALGVNLISALIAILVGIGFSLYLTRSIATPIDNLVETATQIANGDLDRVARVERADEIGTLARAFNTMTAQLRELIDGLERRVTERTNALQRRAVQLETSARVSREATSILKIDDLLARVVNLIREAFGYYHVVIYLVDQDRLALRASSGASSPRHSHLPLGKGSLNGECAFTNQPLLVNNVLADARYLPDEHLPNTRAELVIPLRVGSQVIGTLDAHSETQDAFSNDDVMVMQSLSDQIAIAIENARLYDRMRELAILEERNRLARELHDSITQLLYSSSLITEGWRRMVDARAPVRAEDYLAQLAEINQQALKEMRLLLHELRPPLFEGEGLIGALRQRLDAVENRAGVQARLVAEDLIELPHEIEEGLYRVAQEALNNALKHADATTVIVRLLNEPDHVMLEIADNGKGLDPEAALRAGGMGLASMRERAKQMNGTLELISQPGKGATVRARVKIK